MFFSSGFILRKKRRGPCFHLTGLFVVGGWFIMAWGKKQKQRKLFPSVGLIVEVVICTTRCLWYYLKGEQGENMFLAKRSSWSSKNIPLLLKLDSGRNSIY